MVVVIRFVGAVLVLAACVALGMDLWQSYATGGGFHLAALGERWYQLAPGSLNLSQAVIQRYVSPQLWDPVLVTVLLWPAALVLGGLGVVVVLVGARRRR
jgi:hypothetical protein